ncbi:hypothetical protein, variant 1 [Aphanomyces astaci]|uniref:COP9 signalosome complex subunit 3 n=1 Tax=Aphanomyces astaci TaxID=112090 RepID=W4GYS5_APHAT|nr:hypothetical protein, variant 1 [Aphanomyces astaci]ETV84890.1 hypothetical protein, variant 1 [Aphanomyces astaci]|eukprot:XP_009824908.1 hypothetical protein, variant 1 [Aphanomyces astaci]
MLIDGRLCRLAKGKKLHIHGGGDGGDGKVDEDDDDVDMGTPASVHDDHHVSFLLEVAAYLSQLSSLPVEPKDAITLDELVRLAVQVGIARGAAIRLVHPLRQLLLRWQSSGPAHPNSLTPLHSSFALACVHAKCYHIAVAILDQPIFDVAHPPAAVQSIHVLEYFYYGGMVYTGLKQFHSAAAFFLMTLTVPANALSAVAVEAYKKYMLVSLLAANKVAPLPKSAGLVVSRSIESHVGPYLAFVTAFASAQAATVATAAAAIPDNHGLVKQCVTAFKKQSVQRLTNVYTTVPLVKVASGILDSGSSICDAEACVLDMIEAREIAATIDKHQDMVQLLGVSSSSLEELQATIEVAMECTARLQDVDLALAKNPKYIGRVKDKRAKFAGDDGASAWQGGPQLSG